MTIFDTSDWFSATFQQSIFNKLESNLKLNNYIFVHVHLFVIESFVQNI